MAGRGLGMARRGLAGRGRDRFFDRESEASARKGRQGPLVREGLMIERVSFRYDVERYGEALEEVVKTAQFTAPVVVNGKRILRTRAKCDCPWSVVGVADVDEELVDKEKLTAWLARRGRRIGLGDWRPEKSGVFGRFDVEGVIELADAAAGPSRRGRPGRAGTRGRARRGGAVAGNSAWHGGGAAWRGEAGHGRARQGSSARSPSGRARRGVASCIVRGARGTRLRDARRRPRPLQSGVNPGAACETPGAGGLAQSSILLVNTHSPWIADWMPAPEDRRHAERWK